MKRFKFLIVAAALSVSSTAFAIPTTLSDILGNPAYTETDTTDQAFRLTDTSVGQNDATAFLFLENAGFAAVNTFGIFGSDGTSLEVFNGASSPITSATLAWNTATNLVTNLATSVSAIIDDQIFGFYLGSGDGNTYYSVESWNPLDLNMMLSFNTTASGHPNLLGSDFVLAFEDLSVSSDWDYNDLVVGVSDIAGIGIPTQFREVPEPGPLALMALGLIGMTRLVKRK